MTTRINLPDGSVVNVPEGVSLEQAQAEIERYLAQAQQRSARPSSPVTQDPAVRVMADREGLSPSDYIQSIDPRAAEAHRRRIDRDRMMAMEPMGDGASFPSQQDLDRRARSDARNEATGASGIPDRLPAYGADSYMDATTPSADVNVAGRNPRGGLQYTDQRDSAPRSREQKAQAYPGGISDERQRQAMSIAEAIPAQFGDRRVPQNVSGQPNPDHQFFQSGGLISDVGEVAKRVPGVVGGAARSAADLTNTVLNPYVKYATGYEFPTSASIREGAKDQPQTTGQSAATKDTPAQDGATRPATQEDQAARTQPPQMPRAMSVQGAREQQLGAASQAPLSMGEAVKPGPVPKKAMDNAVKTGMDFLIARSDQITLRMLQAGDIRGATAFREFVRGEQAQKGMEYMNRTFAAIEYKDSPTFAESTAKMVQSYDPDGDWEVDTSNTKLTQDTQGNLSGAIVTLRNKRTGELSEQVYQGLAEVYDGLSRYGDPQGQFKAAQERIQQAQAQKVENAKNFTSAYDEAAKLLFPDGFVDSLGKMLPQEEMDRADQTIRNYIARSRPDLPQPAPRRAPAPAPQQPGAASGVGALIRGFFGGSTGDQPVPTFGG